MRSALILLAAADAAAKFALEKKGQKVLNVKLYETGYTFTNRGDQEKKPQTLREINDDLNARPFDHAVSRTPWEGSNHRRSAPCAG